MSSFSASGGTINFTAVSGDYEETRAARVAVQEIPGGDEFTVDLAGRSPLRWKIQMHIENDSAWGALNAVLGQAGSLNVDTLDGHAAVLINVSRRAPYLDGTTLATGEFLITDT